MDYERDLDLLKNKIDMAKELKIKAEARLEQLKHDEQLILEELNKMGISPDELEMKINELEKQLSQGIKEANSLLPDLENIK